MNRLVLTILALLAGLVATGSPAQAHGPTAADCEIAAVMKAGSAYRRQTMIALPGAVHQAPACDVCEPVYAGFPETKVAVVPVLAGIDRARE